MKKSFLFPLFLLLLLPLDASAQLDRSDRNVVSDLGSVTASNSSDARRKCRERGGNLIVKKGYEYHCFYSSVLPKRNK